MCKTSTKTIEYQGHCWTWKAVCEVPSFISGLRLGTFFLQFGDIVTVNTDRIQWGWCFNLVIDCKAFNAIPNWLDMDDWKLPVIVSERRPACWYCMEKA